jgi:hypothetical protein
MTRTPTTCTARSLLSPYIFQVLRLCPPLLEICSRACSTAMRRSVSERRVQPRSRHTISSTALTGENYWRGSTSRASNPMWYVFRLKRLNGLLTLHRLMPETRSTLTRSLLRRLQRILTLMGQCCLKLRNNNLQDGLTIGRSPVLVTLEVPSKIPPSRVWRSGEKAKQCFMHMWCNEGACTWKYELPAVLLRIHRPDSTACKERVRSLLDIISQRCSTFVGLR